MSFIFLYHTLHLRTSSMIQNFACNPSFRTYFNVNIPRDFDTFLSEPHPQSLARHSFRYCSSARI